MSRSPGAIQLFENLKNLQQHTAQNVNYLTEQILCSLYQLGVSNYVFKEEEKVELGPLLEHSADYIDRRLFEIGNSFDYDRAPYFLVLRSGLQFLFDKYSNIQVPEGRTIAAVLTTAIDKENIQDLDAALVYWKESWIPGEENFSQKWENASRKQQEIFTNALGDRIWDKFSMPGEKKQLWEKIAITLYGSPKSTASDFGLKKDQKERVEDLVTKCIDYSQKRFSDVYIAVFYTCVYRKGKIDTTVPVIRIRWNKTKTTCVTDAYYLDHVGRIYNTWKNYLEENLWDLCWICVPRDGKYPYDEENVRDHIYFYDQTSRGDLKEALDAVATGSGIASTVGTVAGLAMTLFPPTAVIGGAITLGSMMGGAPAAVYGTGRSIGKLVDRRTHDQSINPFADAEARSCWIVTVSSVLSVGVMTSAQVLAMTARTGYLVGGTTRVLCTTLGVTSISFNALGVLNFAYELNKKDKVTKLDALQFTTSIFFLTHSIVSFKTASTIIKDSQNNVINSERNGRFQNYPNEFDAMLQGNREGVDPGRVRVMHGNAQFIREIRNINNVDEFFSVFNLQPNGMFNINNELIIHPKSYYQMSKEQRDLILQSSKDLKDGKITLNDFNKNLNTVCKEYQIKFENQRAVASENVHKALGVDNLGDIEIDGNKILDRLQPHEIDRLNQVLKESCKNYDAKTIKVGVEFAKKQGCKNLTEFCAAVEYAVRKMDLAVAAEKVRNPTPQVPAGMKKKTYYQQTVADEFLKNPSKLERVGDDFNALRRECDAANTGNPRFGNSMAAANHYDKHPFFPKVDANNNLPASRYFDIATEMCSGPVVDPKWSQNGASLKCTFYSEKYGAMSIRYDNLADGHSVIATLMAKDNIINIRTYNG